MSSITKRPNGRWRARFRDTRGTEHARHFATRAEATAWLQDAHAAEATGTWVPPRAGQITLATYYRRFAARQLWQATTRRSTDHALATCPLAGQPVNQISRADLEAWVTAMVRSGLAPTTVRTRHAAVRGVLAGAVRDGLIGTNPAAGVRLPRVVPRSRAAVLPSPTQVDRLVAAAGDRLGLVVALAAHAGLRLGEIRGLQVRDVDVVNGTITVRRQVRSTSGGGWQVADPKYGSVRVIPVPGQLRTRLQTRVTGRSDLPSGGSFVVPGEGTGPVHPGTVQRAWARAKAAAGVDPALRLHDLRHYYASTLLAAGVDVLTVQRRLGHARASTTLDVYGHVLPSPASPTAAGLGPKTGPGDPGAGSSARVDTERASWAARIGVPWR